KNYSRAVINHYFKSGELLGLRLMSYHNVYFILNLFNKIQTSIKNGNFLEEKKKFLEKFNSSSE
ncbi:MAG: tRNA-guanine transglycosylase, partial [Endomicrobia bacterium]|nr:tRNA-guanine transglycosylase [Endomicrobiia bacterium]